MGKSACPETWEYAVVRLRLRLREIIQQPATSNQQRAPDLNAQT